MSDPTEEARRIVEDILISHIRGNCTVEVEKIEKKIAAALAARDNAEIKALDYLAKINQEEIAKLKGEIVDWIAGRTVSSAHHELMQEATDLRAQLAAEEKIVNGLEDQIDECRNIVKGMERAKEILKPHSDHGEFYHGPREGCIDDVISAIDAEIAKMGKPQPDETTELKGALDSVSFPDRRWK